MLVLMCGLPSSGKTECSNLLVEFIPGTCLVRPEDWLPDEAKADEKTEKDWRIQSWKLALELADSEVKARGPDSLVILDCGNSKHNTVSHLIATAKRRKHRALVLYVHSSLSLCESRAKKWVGSNVIQEYVINLKSSLQWYRDNVELVAIDNRGTLDDLRSSVNRVAERINAGVPESACI